MFVKYLIANICKLCIIAILTTSCDFFFRYNAMAALYKVKGFPTIKFFKNGHSLDYNGARNENSIISFVNRAKR